MRPNSRTAAIQNSSVEKAILSHVALLLCFCHSSGLRENPLFKLGTVDAKTFSMYSCISTFIILNFSIEEKPRITQKAQNIRVVFKYLCCVLFSRAPMIGRK